MKKLFTLLTLLCAVTGVWAQDATFTMSSIFDGSNQSADVEEPVEATVTTTASKSNAKDGKLGSDGNYFEIVLKSNTFSDASINGYINTTNTEKNWGFQFSTDGGATWGTELTQANDGNKTAHDIIVGVTIPSNANGIRIIRRAGTSTIVNSITLTLASADPVDPVFSLSASEIGLDETAQIKVNAKSGLDGLTMNDLAYDVTVISIDETGKITPVAVGTSAITFTTAAVESKYNAGSANLSITVTAPVVATPVISPADGSKFYGESQVVTATCATEGAVLSYSIDNEATWTVLPEEGITITETTTIIVKAEKDGYVASKATATITKEELVLDERQDIAASATWDWSKYGTKEIKTENTPFYRETVLVSNVEKYGYAAPAEDFGPAQALTLKGDYIVRDSKYCQVTEATFKTSVPGTVGVVFSNTGGSRPYRYLSVNGKLTEFKSNVSNATTEATGIEVSAGEVVINGVVDPEAETNYEGYTGNDAGQINFLRIYSITFTAGGTDGIQTVNNNAANNGVIYNLAGQRVMNAQKGLFIINGNKVVIK